VAAGRLQLPATVLATLVPPVLLFVLYLLGLSVNIPVMLGITIIMLLLIFVRVALMIRTVAAQNCSIADYASSLEASHTKRDALEAALRRQAFYDDLTGLPNRALFRDRVTQELEKTTRTGHSVALCFGDLDGFSAVNNTQGHALGDSVLVAVAELLSSIVRPGDTVARLGGDEFVVVMTDVTSLADATDFAHRIVSTLNQSIEIEHNRFELSISVGVAISNPDSTTPELTAQADAAMYEAKHAGKNTVAVFVPAMQAKLAQRLDISSGFRGALERHEFFLQYQPMHHLSTGRLVGFEALARWDNPTRGIVMPNQFINLAEESGFIIPLGADLLTQACTQAARWNAERVDPLVVWVNLSRRQLNCPDIIEQIASVLATHALPASQLGLEVTESALIDDPDHACSVLTQLRALGVRIAVDDFGTGYSSLSHIRQYPLDVLKIDKSFVNGLAAADPVSAALVQTIIRLATDLQLTTVAEGIETELQRETLTDMGCEFAQGYLFARPLDCYDADRLVGLPLPLPLPFLQG
jgi:diguanylate cyclase (GGDEF)-like protein